MDVDKLRDLLEGVRAGETSVGQALDRLRALPYTDLGYARLDTHRALRQGMPEVVLCQGKTAEQVRSEGTPDWLVPHRVFEGNRPSNMILASRLTAEALGLFRPSGVARGEGRKLQATQRSEKAVGVRALKGGDGLGDGGGEGLDGLARMAGGGERVGDLDDQVRFGAGGVPQGGAEIGERVLASAELRERAGAELEGRRVSRVAGEEVVDGEDVRLGLQQPVFHAGFHAAGRA